MIEALSWLNNREISILIWFSIVLGSVWIYNPTRLHIWQMVMTLATSKIGTILLLCTAYTMAVILWLQNLDYWEMPLTKDATIWLFGFAFYSVYQVNQQKNQTKYFKSIVLDSIKLIVIVQFVTGTYVMSLVGELIFIPVLVFLSILIAMSEHMQKRDSKYSVTTNIFNFFLVALLGYVLYKCAYSLIVNPSELFSFIKLKEFTLPIILTFTFLPLLYFLSFYMFYEMFAIRLSYKLKKNKKLIRYAKLKLLIKSRLSIDKLRQLESRLSGRLIENRKDLDLRLAD